MAKDPAILFYVQDFLVGSSLLTPVQKGHYITLLCYQQQSETGSLSVDFIKSIMKSDFNKHWFHIAHKFEADGNGFFNKRMRAEIERRKKFSNKQKENANKRWQSHGNATAMPLETEIEIETPVVKMGGAGGIEISLGMDLPGNVLEAAEHNQFTHTGKRQTQFIQSQWKVFLSERISNPKKIYYDLPELTGHFLNWIRNKHPKVNGTHQQSSGSHTKPGTSEARIERAKSW